MYIGNTPTSQSFISGSDYFNGTGSQTAFTLTRSVNSVNDIQVTVNNVVQQPNSYTVSGTTLTLSAAPSSGTSNVYVRYLATNQQSFTVGNNTVGYNQLTADMQSKFAMKNRIINGAMVIDQRNAGGAFIPTSGAFVTDRWKYIGTQAGKVASQQDSATYPAGFTYSLVVVSQSAYSIVATDIFNYSQQIEGYNIADIGWGTANAKTVTLSFWVYSSLTGTFGGSLIVGSGSYPFTYSVPTANTWTQIVINIPANTAYAPASKTNGSGAYLSFGLGVGSTYSGTAGAWTGTQYYSATGATSVVGTNGATFYITGVQLEVGSSATGYEYRQYGQELALCQRYYEQSSQGNDFIWTGNITNASTYYLSIPFKVTKRTNPTVTVSTAGASGFNTAGLNAGDMQIDKFNATCAANTTGVGFFYISYKANAEL